MKNVLIVGGLVLVLLVSGAWWSRNLQTNDPDIVSRSGLHWHPHLEIYVKGKQVPVAANIGIGAVHQPMHTHDTSGTIHLEFQGLVRTKDLSLGNFFRIWGKDIRSFGGTMRMTVNGVENTDYENYVLRDGDKIELHYE